MISNPHADDIFDSDRNSWMRALVMQNFNPKGQILLLLNASERGPAALAMKKNDNMCAVMLRRSVCVCPEFC